MGPMVGKVTSRRSLRGVCLGWRDGHTQCTEDNRNAIEPPPPPRESRTDTHISLDCPRAPPRHLPGTQITRRVLSLTAAPFFRFLWLFVNVRISFTEVIALFHVIFRDDASGVGSSGTRAAISAFDASTAMP
jgi:hypothetical protein|eukprot:COSAG01_NODE_1736_length_9364_cov_3.620076_4_plen_132_part_00